MLIIAHSSEWGDIVTVVVGDERREFTVHEGLLRHHSVWFRNRLNGRWGDVKHVELLHDDPATFELFVGFAYHYKLLPPIVNPKASKTTDEQDVRPIKRPRIERAGHHTRMQLTNLYIFADVLQCERLQCAAIDAYCKKANEEWTTPSRSMVQYMYENTTVGCGLRKLVVDEFTKTYIDDDYWKRSDCKALFCSNTHPEFMAEVIIGLFETRNSNPSWEREEWARVNPCDYHDHKNTEKGGDNASQV